MHIPPSARALAYNRRYYPHYVHRKDKLGHPFYYERPADINIKALKAAGVTDDALLRHYLFITEYMWGVRIAGVRSGSNPSGQQHATISFSSASASCRSLDDACNHPPFPHATLSVHSIACYLL